MANKFTPHQDLWCPECRRGSAYCRPKLAHNVYWTRRPEQSLQQRAREFALTVPCPFCGAPADRRCQTTRGYRRTGNTQAHKGRVRDALAAGASGV